MSTIGKRIIVIGVAVVVISATLAILIFASSQNRYQSHAAIRIDVNSDLIAQNGVSRGSGTAEDPFIIELWDISASRTDGVRICNMSKYIIIRNLSVHDGGVNYNGISLWNCSNVKVYNCTCWNNLNGMHIWSSKVIISENNCSRNNQSGILMVGDNLTISNNSIDSNGWAGINCEGCLDSEIEHNDIADNPWGIKCHDIEECAIRENSILNHDPLMTIYDGIDIACSHHILVVNNTIINTHGTNETRGYDGISLVRPLGGGDNITVEGNYISGWHGGIWSSLIEDGIIRFNLIQENSIGLSLMGIRTEIYGNSFINNTLQAETIYAYTSIFWNASYPIGGNYWGDYTGMDLKSGDSQNLTGGDGIGDTFYTINSGNQDCYPLMDPSPYARTE